MLQPKYSLAGLAISIACATSTFADGFGAAGVLSGKNKEDLPPIILSAGEPISAA